MKTPSLITFNFVWTAIAFTLLCLSPGCEKSEKKTAPSAKKTESVEARMTKRRTRELPVNLEAEIIQLVREWYATNRLEVPDRIVIHEQNATNWIVFAGPEWRQKGFEIDPVAKRIVRAAGD